MTVFMVASRYLRPLDEVDKDYPGHIAWVTSLYESGTLLVSGRQTPPIGGAMVLLAVDEEEIWTLLDRDPFHQLGHAEYKILAKFESTDFPRRSQEYADFELRWETRHSK